MDTAAATTLEIEGHRVRVVHQGVGPDVVVLHGWGGRMESMAPVIDCLSGAFRVTAVDLPGFGGSPVPPGVWGTPDYATFVRDLLARLEVERAHFVGHSFGGRVSYYLAAVHPQLVDKLVLAAPSGIRVPPSPRIRAKRALARAGRVAGYLGPPGRRMKEAVYERLGSSDYKQAGAMQPILVKVVNEDLSPLLARIRASTLLVWGETDDAVSRAAMQKMESLIPDAGFVLFEGAGHFAYLDEGARFCRVVRHFFGVP